MEAQTQFSPEDAGSSFAFKIGEEDFGFDGKFTERESKREFVGVIRGSDGKEFTGSVEDLSGGRYRIVDFDGDRGEIESPAEVGPATPEGSAAAGMAPVGLEDAAALVAMEAAPEQQVVPAAEPQP